MPRAVGLDIGRTSVKIASVDVSSKRTRLMGFACGDIEPGLSDEEHQREVARTIDRLFREGRFDRNNVICSLESEGCILRDITVPFKSRDQIDKIIRFEAEHHLVATSIDDVAIDYIKVGEIGEKSRLLLVAARKDRVCERLLLLDGIGIDPLEFDLDVVAIYNAVSQTPLVAEHDNYVVVDVGPAQVQILVVEERGLSHVRVSRIGAEAAGTSASPSPSDPRSGDAGNLINVASSPVSADVSWKFRSAYLDRLTKVLRQFLMGVRLRNPPEMIILTGVGSDADDVRETFEREFELPTHPVNLAQHMELEATVSSDYSDKLDTGATAIGLALKGCGVDRGGMSFRRDDLAYQRRFEQIRLHLVAICMLAFLVAFVPAAYFYRLKTERQTMYDKQFTLGEIWEDPTRRDRGVVPEIEAFLKNATLQEALDLAEEDVTTDVATVRDAAPSKRISAVEKLLTKYEESVNTLRGVTDKVPPIESAFMVLAEIFKRVEEATRQSKTMKVDPVRLEQIDISQQTATLRIWTPTLLDSELIQTRLKILSPQYFQADPARGWQFVGASKPVDNGEQRVLKADRIREEDRLKDK